MSSQKPPEGAIVRVPVSLGEIVDKITILRIKERMIEDAGKIANVRRELSALEQAYLESVGAPPPAVVTFTEQLEEVNKKLWDVEDELRDCERDQDFTARFVTLARSVYHTNDERARLKREINQALGSEFVEEKSYASYAQKS